MTSCAISYSDAALAAKALLLSDQLGLPLVAHTSAEFDYLLIYTRTHLELQSVKSKTFKPLFIDFLHGKLRHRRLYGGGKKQLLARACGLKGSKKPTIIDATAGLGRDAFVLASLGCPVLMLERSAIIAALLQDGLERLNSVTCATQAISLRLEHVEACTFLSQLTPNERPDVIFLDPMHPMRQKSALVKKEMRIIRDLVGADLDAEKLLSHALQVATQRVVLKLPRNANTLPGSKPSLSYQGKSTRFDVFLIS